MQNYNLFTVCANNFTQNTLFTPSLLIEVNKCDIMTSFCNTVITRFGRLKPTKSPYHSPPKAKEQPKTVTKRLKKRN